MSDPHKIGSKREQMQLLANRMLELATTSFLIYSNLTLKNYLADESKSLAPPPPPPPVLASARSSISTYFESAGPALAESSSSSPPIVYVQRILVYLVWRSRVMRSCEWMDGRMDAKAY